MKERLWTVARFPNGSWSTGGKPDCTDYELCSVYSVLADSENEAKSKGQSMHRKAMRQKAKALLVPGK